MQQNQTVALVTGANRGIGLEIARQLARKGVTVLLGARELAKAEAAGRQLAKEGLTVSARQLDVADPASVDRLARVVAGEFGRLDVLVNNAGVLLDKDKKGLDADLNAVKETLE